MADSIRKSTIRLLVLQLIREAYYETNKEIGEQEEVLQRIKTRANALGQILCKLEMNDIKGAIDNLNTLSRIKQSDFLQQLGTLLNELDKND